MPRKARNTPAGYIYHVLNRSNAGMRLFRRDDDYALFEQIVGEVLQRAPTRLLGWCIMPDHWHLIVWPKREGELSDFVRRITQTHVQRWHASRNSTGSGHVYAGRFRALPVEPGEPLLDILRFVQRNPVRNGLVDRAEDWRWSSLWIERNGSAELRGMLTALPVERPAQWLRRVNATPDPHEVRTISESIRRSRPYGTPLWVVRTVQKLGMEWTVRPLGRAPKNAPSVREMILKAGARRP
jgi:putative transposase